MAVHNVLIQQQHKNVSNFGGSQWPENCQGIVLSLFAGEAYPGCRKGRSFSSMSEERRTIRSRMWYVLVQFLV
jgi:hypothetical protein